MKRSWKLAEHVRAGKYLSCDIITPGQVRNLIRRGVIDARPDV
jgi:hypothetical protein